MGVGVAGVRGRGSVTPDLLLVSPPTVECGVCCHPSSRYIRYKSLTDTQPHFYKRQTSYKYNNRIKVAFMCSK